MSEWRGGDNDIFIQATAAIVAGLYSAGAAAQGFVDSLLHALRGPFKVCFSYFFFGAKSYYVA